MPNHFTLTFFLLRRRDVSCSHSNRVIFTCEDNMLFSHVKISCFRAKSHLVFHWYLYNNNYYLNCVDCIQEVLLILNLIVVLKSKGPVFFPLPVKCVIDELRL